MYSESKKQAMKALDPVHGEEQYLLMQQRKSFIKRGVVLGQQDKKGGKPIISLLNPQLDLYDGLYNSPTASSAGQQTGIDINSPLLNSNDSMSDEPVEVPAVKSPGSP